MQSNGIHPERFAGLVLGEEKHSRLELQQERCLTWRKAPQSPSAVKISNDLNS